MKIIYFIEKDGVKKYKCDTVWSVSTDPSNAKIHTPDHDRFFESYLNRVRSWIDIGRSDPRKLEDRISINKSEHIIGSVFGYSTFNEDQLKNPYLLKEKCILEDFRLKIITGIVDGKIEFEDYKKIDRSNKIITILE